MTALHDPTEGGLATGVRELALAAGCGATIDRDAVPVLPETAAVAEALGLDPLGMLASGSLLAAVEPRTPVPAGATEIGELTESGFVLRVGGEDRELPVYDTDETARVLGSAA